MALNKVLNTFGAAKEILRDIGTLVKGESPLDAGEFETMRLPEGAKILLFKNGDTQVFEPGTIPLRGRRGDGTARK